MGKTSKKRSAYYFWTELFHITTIPDTEYTCTKHNMSTNQPAITPPPVPQGIVYNMPQNDQQCVPISNSNMQMLFNNIQTINDRLQKFENIMSDKLPKLDVLDVINKKFENFEKNIYGMKVEIDQIKDKQNEHHRILAVEEEHHHNIEDRVRKLELGNKELENENIELRDNFIKLQSNSMKYNLIFSGIQQRDNENENTETVLKEFLTHELGITNANEINFQNVHRLRKRTNGKPRSIIARFTNYIEHERVFK